MAKRAHPIAHSLAMILILFCGLVGGYAAMFVAYRDGFFHAVKMCVTARSLPGFPSEQCDLDMSHSPGVLRNSLTGIEPVDSLGRVLLEFFAQGLRKGPGIDGIDLQSLLTVVYVGAQFGGAWLLMALEGLRRGNRRSILRL